jgi:hypothetical protein
MSKANNNGSGGAAARPKNWLLIQVRTWHSRLGVFLFPLIILAAATGIYLNHKDLFERKPAAHTEGGGGGATKERKGKPAKGKPAAASAFNVDGALAVLRVSFAEALAAARSHLGGDAALEKVELKDEKGTLIYKVKAADGREVIVDASSGGAALKGEYTKVVAGGGGRTMAEARTDWGKVMKDLHTGKVGGTAGKLVVDFVALTLVLLSLSGLYLWAVPILRKRQNAKAARAAAAAGNASPAAGAPTLAGA